MLNALLIEELRWVNFVLAVVGYAWLVIRSTMRWWRYPYALRITLLVLSFYVLVSAWTSVEMAIQNTEPGTRSYGTLFANLALLVALTITQKTVLTPDENGRLPRGR